MLDLADIFAPAPDVPSAAKPWDSSAGHSALAQAGPLRSDPWDSLGKISNHIWSNMIVSQLFALLNSIGPPNIF